jgi:hypothetical protein
VRAARFAKLGTMRGTSTARLTDGASTTAERTPSFSPENIVHSDLKSPASNPSPQRKGYLSSSQRPHAENSPPVMFIPRCDYGCLLTPGRPGKEIGGSVPVSGEIYSCTSTSAVGSSRNQAALPTTVDGRTYILSGASSCHPHSGLKGCRD